MKADRRHNLASNALARELEGFPDKLKRWGNTALTVLLVCLAIFMLIRWRMLSTEQAHQTVLNELSNARSYLDELRNPDLAKHPPDFVANARQLGTARTNEAISTVLNSSEDAKVKAEAMIVRGDLYWCLANFPELPGATTQPALRSPESSEEYLKKSADAYNVVLNTSDYAKQHDAVIGARFGLAAIAENRRDWDEAKRQLDMVVNDPDALPALVKIAKDQQDSLAKLQTPLYVVPATQPALASMMENAGMPTTNPTTLPGVASTEPTSQPAH
jgi:hypothetical protein